MATPGMKKRYKPPEADSNTFPTQKEFLDSLQPIPLDSVPEYHRKCAHCWKRYGESDPGYDNAEEAVRFRCSHVFGQKCMQELFGLPEPVRVDLIELSFEPGSKGAELGCRLSAYVDQCGVDKGALLIGGKREKDFTRLLNEVKSSDRSEELLGKEWSALLLRAMMPRADVEDVHFLDNAIIFDMANNEERLSKIASLDESMLPVHTLTHPFSWSIDPPIYQASIHGNQIDTFAGQYLLNAAEQATSESSDGESDEKSFGDLMQKTFGDLMQETPSESSLTALLTPSSSKKSSLFSKGPKLEAKNVEKSAPIPSKNAENEPAKVQYSAAEDSLNYKALYEKFQDATSKLSTPELRDFVPASVKADLEAVPDKVWLSPEHSLESVLCHFVKDKIKEKDSKAGQWSKVGQKSTSKGGGLLGKLKAKLQSSNNLETVVPESVPVSDQLKAIEKLRAEVLEKKLKLAKVAITYAEKAAKEAKSLEMSEAAQLAAYDAQKKRISELRETRQKEIISVLARALAKIYEKYEQNRYTGALAAGESPPVKKLKLAPSESVSPSSAAPTIATTSPAMGGMYLASAKFVEVSANVHVMDIDAGFYEVPQPNIYHSPMGMSDEDDGDEGLEDDRKPDITGKTFMISRRLCTSCRKSMNESSPKLIFSNPKYITWKDSKKVPDGCPVCKAVLFRRS